MADGPSIAVTADLHWGHHARGDSAVRDLVDFLSRQPPDVLLLGGDIGTGVHFATCLSLFDGLHSIKALVAGNHDVWVLPDDQRGNSRDVYEKSLPGDTIAHGFHYLDVEPLFLKNFDLSIVGSMNWYDYSWSIDEVRQTFPDELWRLAAKRFRRGQHNDANFVRWDLDDAAFTTRLTNRLHAHLEQACSQSSQMIVLTHHPASRALSFPEPNAPPDMDRLLWVALMGNVTVEQLLEKYAGRIPLTFSGHTHRAREATVAGGRGFNVGGDYHFKRLLWFDSPSAPAIVHEFGDPVK